MTNDLYPVRKSKDGIGKTSPGLCPLVRDIGLMCGTNDSDDECGAWSLSTAIISTQQVQHVFGVTAKRTV